MPTTVNVTPVQEQAYMLVEIDHTPETVYYYRVEMSPDNGVTWFTVRFATQLSPQSGNYAEIEDYEALANNPSTYRARAFDENDSPIDEWSLLVSDTLELDRWWLKDPLVPSDNMVLELTGDYLEVEELEDKGRFRPLGRSTPIITSDIVRDQRIETLNIDTLGYEPYENLLKLRGRQRTLLLQGPLKEQWYLRLGEELKTRIMNTQSEYRKTTVNTDPQARP